MQMLGCVLLLLPATVQAQEATSPVSCDQQSMSHDGFDEMALLQQELTPASGMNSKSTQEWAAHWSDHVSKIHAEQRVLDNETVGGQLSKLRSGNCADDPMWRDADGDGCEIYRFAIQSGKTTRELACNGGGVIPERPTSPGLRGARKEIVADATAKIFCPLTCGMCQPETRENAANASAGRAANAAVTASDRSPDVATENATTAELEVDPSNPQTFLLQIGVSSSSGPSKKNPESWAEHAYDHRSLITPDQQILDNETVAHRVSLLQKGEACVDDPLWRDADGDGCEIYKFAIESGKVKPEVACGGGGQQRSRGLRGAAPPKVMQVVADATAKVFCPVTCGVC